MEEQKIQQPEKAQEQKKESMPGDANALKNDILSIRKSINEASSRQEDIFKRIKPLKDKLFEKNKQIMPLKKERNDLTRKVKDLKAKRDKLNKEVSADMKSFNERREAARKIAEKYRIKNPFNIPAEIKAMEFKIETEALSPKKEEELMKVIKQRKKIYNELMHPGKKEKDSKESKPAENAPPKDFRKIRDDAESCHAQIQELARLAQEKHEKMIAVAKELDPIRKEISELDKELDKAKMSYVIKNAELKDKLKQLGALGLSAKKFNAEEKKERPLRERRPRQQRMDRHPKGRGDERRKENAMLIEKKKKEVEEKIKTGKKLTTEDLLAFQENSR